MYLHPRRYFMLDAMLEQYQPHAMAAPSQPGCKAQHILLGSTAAQIGNYQSEVHGAAGGWSRR
jgi:hypothetical protein